LNEEAHRFVGKINRIIDLKFKTILFIYYSMTSNHYFSNFIKVIKDVFQMIWFAIYHFIKGNSVTNEYQKYCDQRTIALRENLRRTQFGKDLLNQIEKQETKTKSNEKNDDSKDNTNTDIETNTESNTNTESVLQS